MEISLLLEPDAELYDTLQSFKTELQSAQKLWWETVINLLLHEDYLNHPFPVSIWNESLYGEYHPCKGSRQRVETLEVWEPPKSHFNMWQLVWRKQGHGQRKPFSPKDEVLLGTFLTSKRNITQQINKKLRLSDMKHVTCQENSDFSLAVIYTVNINITSMGVLWGKEAQYCSLSWI